ncbi:MAG: hypothetical protein RLZZ301_1526 [Bacteroidota bacterium]
MAHVGVLKALEERHIPIDFVVGTSAGALVAAMYACGYSPAEIESYVLSEAFQHMAMGQLEAKDEFFFYAERATSGMFNFSFAQDSVLQKSIPNALVDPCYFDFEMLKIFGLTSASIGTHFDDFMVPFRCVASDVEHKKSVVFSTGNLNQAVRASMTFPLYINPIRIDGTLYFDGGLYNNFPMEVLYRDFHPDYIIGSNVSKNLPPVNESDFFGLLTSMMTTPTNYALPCTQGLIIEPETRVGTFDFDEVKQAIADGYAATMLKIDSIEANVIERQSPEALAQKRLEFRARVQDLKIAEVKAFTDQNVPMPFAKAALLPWYSHKLLYEAQLETRYFHLSLSPQLAFMYPTLEKLSDSTQRLNLYLKKSNQFRVDVGGLFASRAINTAYFSLAYRHVGKVAQQVQAESYFGKFYGSVRTAYELVLPGVFPISISPYFTLNRWDYFRSFATFFEDVKPSFLVQYESYGGLQLKLPTGNHSRLLADSRYFYLDDQYYQTATFAKEDTADVSTFRGYTTSVEFTKNTLNRKQFASSGTFFQAKARYVNGFEHTYPGSTSVFKDTVLNQHHWLSVQLELMSFPFQKKQLFNVGIHAKTVLNSQSLFANYTASMLTLPGLNVLPDLETYFISAYRSTQYVSVGTNFILSPVKNLDVRLDVYGFLPIIQLQQNQDGTFSYTKPLKGRSLLASGSVIYHTPIGPVRASINYFPKYTQKIQVQVSFGYILFNERAIR